MWSLPRTIIVVRHVSALIGLVKSGLGPAVVPKLTVPQGPDRILRVRLQNPSVKPPACALFDRTTPRR